MLNFTTVLVVAENWDDVEGIGSDERSHRSGADSPAPLPPHERAWRHPSEVGFATVTSVDATRINIGRNGRSLIGFVSVAGVFLSVALVLALQPDSLRSDTHDIIALTNSRLRVASFDPTRSSPDRVETPASGGSTEPPMSIELSKSLIGSRLVDTFRTMGDAVSTVTRPVEQIVSSESTTTTSTIPIVNSTRAMGILSESGDHLLTTMAAVEGIESIDIRLPNGKTVRGRIVHTLPDLHVAILAISDEETTEARADIKASGLGTSGEGFSFGQPVMVLIENPFEFVIGATLDGVIVALDTNTSRLANPSSIAEGAPVVSKTGHLIGLCTHAGGRLGFIPIDLLESALSRLLTVDGGATTTQPSQ